MKKNLILIIGALLFSLLFFHNRFGLNLLIFSVVALVFLISFNRQRFREVKVISFAILYILTAVVFFINNSFLSFLSNLISFFILLGVVSKNETSIYVKFLNGFFSAIAAHFYNFYNREPNKTKEESERPDYVFYAKIVGIPLIAIVVFVILYRSANPYFDAIIQKIDLSFINLQWILFTVLGYFLFLNFTKPVPIEAITIADINTPNNLDHSKIKEQKPDELSKENKLGLVLITSLNLLIVFYLLTDGIYLKNIRDLTAPGLSKAVHEGIAALITSIIIAILIILYFFRGNLNFYTKNKALKIVTLSWIGLNVLLIITTSYKNYLYITAYGLTYKRIGVFVYLLLCLGGLITTFLKVINKNNFWYLLRRNTELAFVFLLVASLFNWDRIITEYNILQVKEPDLNYLIELSNNSIPLKDYLDRHIADISPETAGKILVKYGNYLEENKMRKWQEMTYQSFNLNE